MSKKKFADNNSGEVIDKSPVIYQRNKLKVGLNIIERNDLTERQKQLIELILEKNTKVVFIDGPAGTSKTWTAVLCGLRLLNSKRVSDLLYVRTIIESASKSLGSLPGEFGDKFEPFITPLKDKLDELLPKPDIDLLFKEKRIQPMPINYLRGANINAKYVLIDESQNFNYKEIVTVLTRIGEYSKFIFVGDSFQSDLNGHSGFRKMFDIFNNDESKLNGIYCFEFTKEDIVRSGVLKFIMEKLENYIKTPTITCAR